MPVVVVATITPKPDQMDAVREAILAYGPPLSLHGHIHEGKGAVKLGTTLSVNPGSSYEDGVLQAAIVDLDEKKGTVKRYLLING